MLRRIIAFVFFISTVTTGYAQLVTRKDYKAAIGVQAGAECGIFPSAAISQIRITPTAGLKMTFPFNRKWFVGSEINYSRLHTRNKYPDAQGEDRIELDLHQIMVPVYAKYMLNSNRATLLFGGHLTCRIDNKSQPFFPVEIKKWNCGITAGYEQLFTSRLHLTFKIDYGLLSQIESSANKKFTPLKAGLTLSYDLLRIGDCGCH